MLVGAWGEPGCICPKAGGGSPAKGEVLCQHLVTWDSDT